MRIQVHVDEVVWADVPINDIIDEMLAVETPRTVTELSELLGRSLKLLALVPDSLVKQLNATQIGIITGVLRTQLERYSAQQADA